ncbi:hypothetical protein GCM10017774_68640 [Lentzea cavernae]|uniref:Uncharacterized protein n=1 Tax=Lentzea cavernae TaxID=2020703 RepID=A0ABQ3MQ05_9PSEU|nr:hypothetical protein GCM10017774_68640 [Lentzea cavernae]
MWVSVTVTSQCVGRLTASTDSIFAPAGAVTATVVQFGVLADAGARGASPVRSSVVANSFVSRLTPRDVKPGREVLAPVR